MSLLKATSISKSFAGVRALRDVSLDVRAGEVHALVGENGAGKSTLIRVVTGAIQPDEGSVELFGHVVAHNTPAVAKALGVSVIYQQPALFPDLTVNENIAIGLEPGGLWRRTDWRARRTRATELLGRIGAHFSADATVDSLSMPEQQLVEIARAVGARTRLLIMDEPTASLSEQEVVNLFRVVRELRDQGTGVIYISHRLDELFTIADRVTVLRDGEAIATREMFSVDQPELIRLMVGRELSAVFPKRAVPIGQVVLEARGLGCREARLQNIQLTLRSGEILGIAGLVGSGRTELARILFGLTPADSGEIRMHGRPVKITSPATAIEQGVAYVPEDRRRHGVIPEMPVAANITLACLSRLSKGGFLDHGVERDLAASLARRMAVKTPALFTPVGHLSGGNQQKVALARWLATEPSIIILDEPTQGIDVGAKSEIHRLMCDLAEHGLGIIMISSELPEILGMSDRVVVMAGGKIAGVLERAEATQQKILALALGSTSAGP